MATKALQFVSSVPRYLFTRAAGAVWAPAYWGPLSCLVYRDIPEPALPGPEWVRVRTLVAGICGTDLSMIRLHQSPALSAWSSFPFVPGHELVGRITATGPDTRGWQPGDRVVVEPLLGCGPRGVNAPCRFCRGGEPVRCENLTGGRLAPGILTGGCRDTGGGWGESFVAHPGQLLRVPETMADEEAVLVEPLAVAVQAAGRNLPRDDQTCLVVGAGAIGLLTVAAIRVLGSRARMVVVARHPHQAELARRYGADEVVRTDGSCLREVAARLGARVAPAIIGPPAVLDGADVVFECAGTSRSLADALRLAGVGSRVVVTGLASFPRGVDWTYVWLKELTVSGSFCYGTLDRDGQAVRAFTLALELAARREVDLRPLLTHCFALKDYRKAFRTLIGKGRHRVVKACFRFA